MKTLRASVLVSLFALTPALHGDYADIISAFQGMHGSTYFPADTKSLDDVESAFGPRVQQSTGNYDWHRGFDVDAPAVDAYGIVAAYDGTFYDYRTSFAGGYTVILRHTFDSPINYKTKTLNYFYTWYLHLYDDGIANNGVSTDDLVSGYSVGDPITAGTEIGRVGDSGSPPSGSYAPHLHFELRVGSTSSLEFQLNNPMTTQWGFDPHMNPMFLFAPGSYTQSMNSAGHSVGEDVTVDYSISDDDYTNLDGFTVTVREAGGGDDQKSHTLGFNERVGFDATTNENLDIQDTDNPYIDPQIWKNGSTYETDLIVPSTWIAGYENGDYELYIESTDIWGNTQNATISLVPEPATYAGMIGFLILGVTVIRRRQK